MCAVRLELVAFIQIRVNIILQGYLGTVCWRALHAVCISSTVCFISLAHEADGVGNSDGSLELFWEGVKKSLDKSTSDQNTCGLASAWFCRFGTDSFSCAALSIVLVFLLSGILSMYSSLSEVLQWALSCWLSLLSLDSAWMHPGMSANFLLASSKSTDAEPSMRCLEHLAAQGCKLSVRFLMPWGCTCWSALTRSTLLCKLALIRGISCFILDQLALHWYDATVLPVLDDNSGSLNQVIKPCLAFLLVEHWNSMSVIW